MPALSLMGASLPILLCHGIECQPSVISFSPALLKRGMLQLFDVMLTGLFPRYVRARDFPRRMRRAVQRKTGQ